MARPSKKTPVKVKKLEEAFALDCSVPEACFYADITEKTYYNRVNKDQKLLQRFKALKEKPVLLARQSVVKGMRDDAHLALKYLERKKKKEFSVRQEIDQKIEANINVQEATDDELYLLVNGND